MNKIISPLKLKMANCRHIENRCSPYFFGFPYCILCFDERQLSYRLRYTCFLRILVTDKRTNRQTDGQ